MIGQTLRHYRVNALLGTGGMGVVYRATDTRLEREVALKMLREDLVRDPELPARFQREARLLAALNHPNIAGIHDLEETDGIRFVVLEYVPGKTLAEILTASPPSSRHALEISRQLAEAMEAAHQKGIIHRDLKPGNIKITPEGRVKVLDFGLAKALRADEAYDEDSAPTQSIDHTRTGAVLGTPAYMSPEQARGLRADKRADIWAFGCVLFEMLARKKAFDAGKTTSDSIAAILSQEPDWNALPASTPRCIRRMLKRCLEKTPQKRLQDIGDARLELEEELAAPEAAPVEARRRSRTAAIAVAGLLVGVAVTAAVFPFMRPAAPAPAVTRFSIPLGPGEVVNPLGHSVRLSTNGSRLAWVTADVKGVTQITYRELVRLENRKPEGATGASSPVFSPDGRFLAFVHSGSRAVKKVALSGGGTRVVCPIETAGNSFWADDGTVLLTLSYPGAIMRVSADGGTPQAVTTLDTKAEERFHSKPFILPGGRAFLYTIAGGGMDTYDDARIAVQSLKTGEQKILIQGGTAPVYSPTGHIVYARDGKLLAAPFDANRLEVTGDPVPVVEGVFMCVNTGAAHFSLAQNGTLAYAPGMVLGGERQLTWVDRKGKAEAIPVPPKPYLHPRISPDGKKLAVEIEGPVHDFWAFDTERGTMTKMTTEGSSHWPLWTPDGSHLTYRRWLGGHFSMWWIPADRSKPPERLTETGRSQSAASWSPRGDTVAFTQVNMETGPDVYVMDMRIERKPRPFAQTKFAEGSPKFSPDGLWIAYASNESGRNEIYVQAFPGPGAKIQVSTEGGTDAAWRPLGGELYYRDGDKMMAVEVSTGGAFRASRPQLLWKGPYAHGMGSGCGPPGTTSSNYDVTSDGQRFLMIRQEEVASGQINVVLNWTEELKAILQAKKRM